MSRKRRERLVGLLDRQSKAQLAEDLQSAKLSAAVHERAEAAHRARLLDRDAADRSAGAIVEPGRTLNLELYRIAGSHRAACEAAVDGARAVLDQAQAELDGKRERVSEDRLRLRKLDDLAQELALLRLQEAEHHAQVEVDELWLTRVRSREGGS